MTKDINLIGHRLENWPKKGVLAYEVLFLFFSNGIVRLDVINDIIQALTTCTLIIKQVLPKYSDSYF